MKIPLISSIVSWLKKIRTNQKEDIQKEPVEKGHHEPQLEPSHKKTEESKTKPRKHEAAPKKSIPEKSRPPVKKPWDVSDFSVEPSEGKTRFHDIKLPKPIMHGIFDLGFKYCTDIQGGILPKAILGNDVIGQAQTGTGKSAAFLITILAQLFDKKNQKKRFKGTPRALILAPTRELVIQIEKDAVGLAKYTHFNIVSVFGGMGYERQRTALSSRMVDIVVATPGRLIDFYKKRVVKLNQVEFLVIDEADRMLDMGFIPDIKQIVYSTPEKSKRQTMFFSATLNSEVERYARQWTRDPFRVEIDPGNVASENINQIVYILTANEKFPLLYNLIQGNGLERALVFVNRKDQSRILTDKLNSYGINSAVISGDITQHKRLRALEDFKQGKIRVLVATDVAARGIHIDDISHVINYNFPQDPEHYIHRIGRTGRAGSHGTSISFACEDDSFYIPAIEKVLGYDLKCEYPDTDLLKELPEPKKRSKPAGKKNYTKSNSHRKGRPRQYKQKPKKPGKSRYYSNKRKSPAANKKKTVNS